LARPRGLSFAHIGPSQCMYFLVAKSCKAMYVNLLKQNGGALIWSFLKPLRLGKILYTPDNDVTKQIVSSANFTFNDMSHLLNTMKVIVDSQRQLVDTLNGTEQVRSLQVWHHHRHIKCVIVSMNITFTAPP